MCTLSLEGLYQVDMYERVTVELLLTHKGRDAPKAMGFEGLWASRYKRPISVRAKLLSTVNIDFLAAMAPDGRCIEAVCIARILHRRTP